MVTVSVLGLIALCSLNAADSATVEAVERLLSRPSEDGGVHGAALVMIGGEVICRDAYGMSNRDGNFENEPDTKFLIGSLTKSFTAALVLQLMEEGAISLDGTVSQYLPWYRADTGGQVTIEHLLSHTSGIPNYLADVRYFTKGSQSPYTRRTFVETYCSGDLEFKPGSQFAYSPSGYVILGEIIETLTGKPLSAVFSERIAKPLDLHSTGFVDVLDNVDALASGYMHSGQGYRPAIKIEVSTAGGSGAMYSTVDDLLAWYKALAEGRVISPQSVDQMFKPKLNDYGYGWFITNRRIGNEEVTVHSHGGRINGFNSAIIVAPTLDICVILLNNVEQFSAMQTATQVMDAIDAGRDD